MGLWRSVKEWLTSPAELASNRIVQDLLDEVDQHRKDKARLMKHCRRLEKQVENAQAEAEVQRQRAMQLLAQSRRCKCRS